MTNKKGYTLIELLVVIAIMSILTLAFVSYAKAFKHHKNEVQVEYYNSALLMLFNKARAYCLKNNTSGYIQVDVINNYVAFWTNTQRIYVLKFPNEYKLNSSLKYYIGNQALNTTSFDLTYKDLMSNKNPETIIPGLSIDVGAGYVEIKERNYKN